MRQFLLSTTLASLLVTQTFGQQVLKTYETNENLNDISDIEINQLNNEEHHLQNSVTKTRLGHVVKKSHHPDMVEFVIDAAPKPSKMNSDQKADLLNHLTDDIVSIEQGTLNLDFNPTSASANNEVYGCFNRLNSTDPTEPGLVLPIYVGTATPSNPITSWQGLCYNNISMEFVATSASTFEVIMNMEDKSSPFCKEGILFANTEITHLEIFFVAGTHKMTFNMPGQAQREEVSFGGIKAFQFCEGLKNELESLIRSIGCFVDPDTGYAPGLDDYSYSSERLDNANVHFRNITMGWEMEERPIWNVDIDESTIRSGDFLAILGYDGLESIIMYGSGSYIGHSVMLLWFEDGLYTVESTDPVIKRTPWKDWIAIQQGASGMTSYLPLKKEIADKFNETAARELFFEMEGVPYGYHNFMYGWVDTPEDNWPPMLPHQFVPILWSWVEAVDAPLAYNMYTEALNLRLGVQDYNITEIAALAGEQGLDLDTVMSMVEQDDFVYSGLGPKDGKAFVCSAFVAALWKAAGLFDPYEINATEFIPGDIYRMAFYDTETPRPQACVDADPDLPYCQLTGKYRQVLPGFNTIQPYDHMNERCPSIAPDYFRPDGC